MKYMTLSDVMDCINPSGCPPQDADRAFRQFMTAAFKQQIEVEGFEGGLVSARNKRTHVPKDLFQAPLLLDWAQSDYNAAFDALATDKGSLRLERGEPGDHFMLGEELLWSGLQVDAQKARELLKARSAPDLAAALKEAIAENGGSITTRDAERIASTISATENQKKIRELLKSLQGPQKRGPRGHRKPSV